MCMQARMHTIFNTCIRDTHKRKYMHSYSHKCTYVDEVMHSPINIHLHTYMHICIHKRGFTYLVTRIHT